MVVAAFAADAAKQYLCDFGASGLVASTLRHIGAYRDYFHLHYRTPAEAVIEGAARKEGLSIKHHWGRGVAL